MSWLGCDSTGISSTQAKETRWSPGAEAEGHRQEMCPGMGPDYSAPDYWGHLTVTGLKTCPRAGVGAWPVGSTGGLEELDRELPRPEDGGEGSAGTCQASAAMCQKQPLARWAELLTQLSLLYLANTSPCARQPRRCWAYSSKQNRGSLCLSQPHRGTGHIEHISKLQSYLWRRS